jgi:hypothetical protein
MSYNSIAWLPLAAGLTAIGLIASYFAYRRRGLRPALFWAALALLPIAAYLTGSIEMFWKIGSAIGKFAEGFAFSAERWAGIAVAGLAAALFFAAGGRRRRKAARQARKEARGGQPADAAGAATQPDGLESGAATKALTTTRLEPAKKPARAGKSAGKASAADDDMKDIEDILRKRGI